MFEQYTGRNVLTATVFEETSEETCLQVEKVERVLEDNDVKLTTVMDNPEGFGLTPSDMSAYMSIGERMENEKYLQIVSDMQADGTETVVDVTDNRPEVKHVKWERYEPRRELGYRFYTIPSLSVLELDEFALEHRNAMTMRLAFCDDDKVLWYESIDGATPATRRIPNDRRFNWVYVEYLLDGEWESYFLWSDWQSKPLPIPIYALAQKEVPTPASPFILIYCVHDVYQSKVMVHAEIDKDGNLYKGLETREALEYVGFSY